MTNLPIITILMATYNGQQFVGQQIASILNQTYPHIQLVIRDDGSKDETHSILKSFAQRDERIILLDSNENLGIKGNFSCLMKQANTEYTMFSDQDDVWLCNKVQLCYDKMIELEQIHGSNLPLLVHTDLKVVDANLDLIAPSFWRYSHLNPRIFCSLNRLLVQNVVTGCTMMVNRAALELSQPVPSQAIMHDWWIALVVATFGHLTYIDEPTIFYRQHGKNDIGAKKYSVIQSIKNLRNKDQYISYQIQLVDQAVAFSGRYASLLNIRQKEIIEAFKIFRESPFLKKLMILYKYQLLTNGILPNLKRLLIVC